MDCVLSRFDGDTDPAVLEIGTTGMATIPISITLNDPSGVVTDDELVLSGFPKSAYCTDTGTLAEARIKDGADKVWASEISVGLHGSGAGIELNAVDAVTGKRLLIYSAQIKHG